MKHHILVVGFLFGAILTASASTITVTNLADSGPGTLYDAVYEANTSPPPVTINFNYTGTPPFRIAFTNSFLQYFTNQVFIDGASQPGYTGQPMVWLDGGPDTNQANFGFLIQGGNSTLRAFRVSGFTSSGVILGGQDGNDTVVGCWIISNQVGITVNNGGNVIGGLSASNRNIISGNTYDGIRVSGPGADSNSILGNYIGLNPTNTSSGMTNGEHGIFMTDASYTLIQGSAAARQVIVASRQIGVNITGTQAGNNVVIGNYIGVDLTGSTSISNGSQGVSINNGWGNRIGGTNAADMNVISGNGGHGVVIGSAAASNNVIQGNRIGTAAAGSPAIQNGGDGIQIFEAPGTLVGGSAAGTGNILSGNRLDGIDLFGTSGAITVQGNLIGLTVGSTVLSNGGYGVFVSGSPGSLIGGSNVNERNYISGNGNEGIYLSYATNVAVQGNLIGIDGSSARKPNTFNGILLNNAFNNLIGGTNAGARNVISGNNFNGIYLGYGSAGNTVQGNYIGLNIAGNVAVTNAAYGIRITDATNNTIGPGNVIAGNTSGQITVEPASLANTIAGNFLGVGADGTTPFPGIGSYGILVNASDTTIGGLTPAERNVIAGNASYGIYTFNCTNVTIEGNYIGLASNGVTAVSNGAYGIQVGLGTVGSVIGGTAPGAGNVINSGYYGIQMQQAVSNAVLGNYIGTTASGTSAVSSVNYAVWLIDSSYNTIGGTNAGAGNVIFAHTLAVTLQGSNTFHNAVQGNYLNLDSLGRIISTNCGTGIDVTDAPTNTIGGVGSARNLIAASGNCIELQGSNTVGTVIQGNYMGVGPDGVSPRAITNVAGNGILIQNASRSLIGGTNFGEGNIIAYRTTGGILIFGTNATGNGMLGNSIYSNGTLTFLDLGIDLNPSGINANDPAPDADIGPNNFQNFPTITNAVSLLGSTRVQGLLASATGKTFRLEFFANDINFPEAKHFLGWTNVTTSVLGTGSFSVVLPGYAATSQWITATATDASNNTSELESPLVQATNAVDTDKDLMPDFWETQYGLNPNSSNAVTADADGDGVPDYEEYVAGTIPNNATSFLGIVTFALGDTNTVAFASSAFRNYNLESAASMNPGSNWTVKVTNALGNGLTETLYDDTTSPTLLYYRVRAIIP